MAGGDPAFCPLTWSIQGRLVFINTFNKSIFLYFLTNFNVVDLRVWLRSDLVLDIWVATSRNTLQQVARDNFGILQTLKICLVETSWVFTTNLPRLTIVITSYICG